MTDSKTPEWADVAARALDAMPPEGPQLRSHRIAFISQALLSAYERGRAEREWQDISTAPKDGTLFLAARDDEWVTMVRWLVDEEAFYEVNNDPSDSWGFGPALPTHWMPLPAPPAIFQLLEVKG